MPKNRFISLSQHSSLEFSRDKVAFVVSQQTGDPQGRPKRTLSLSASVVRMLAVHSMHAPSAHTCGSRPWGKARGMHGPCRKRLWLTWSNNRKGEVAACNGNHSLASAAMQKRPTSKSLQCGSWVRVDMREVSYFSDERHGHNVQTTINRTLYRAPHYT